MKCFKFKLLLLSLVTVYSSMAMALPSLQLGPDPGNPGAWDYVAGSIVNEDTWVTSDSDFDLMAYALDSAWVSGVPGYAYLAASAVPNIDVNPWPGTLDVTVAAGAQTLGIYTSGIGSPPAADPNSLASHGVFDTYYEVYEFLFEESGTVYDIQPGETGSAPGYSQELKINIGSLLAGSTGVHFDLFTVNTATGKWNLGDPDPDKKLAYSFAPFSHDAEHRSNNIPEPNMPGLLAIGLLGLGIARGIKGKT